MTIDLFLTAEEPEPIWRHVEETGSSGHRVSPRTQSLLRRMLELMGAIRGHPVVARMLGAPHQYLAVRRSVLRAACWK